MIICDVYDLSLFINDVEVFAIPGVQIQKLTIHENIYDGLPTFDLTITLPNAYVDSNMFVDGSAFKLVLVSSELEINSKYVFKVWNITEIKQSLEYLSVSLGGILDVFEIYTDANKYNMYASTSEIFKKIATTYNYTNDIDNTNDKQLWVAGRRNVFQFMHHLCKYGWCSDTSAMMWFFDKEKRLMYKDFSRLLKEKSTGIYTFISSAIGNSSDKTFGYNDISQGIYAGTDNIVNGGYGNDFDSFNLLDYKDKTTHAKKVVAESATINISKEQAKGLNYDWFALDVGNFHENYFMAFAQNKRIRATYSTYITLQCQYLQKFRLGQVVNVIASDINNRNYTNKNFSILGMISEIHTNITTDSISASVTVVSQGVNTKSKQIETY